MTRRTEEHTAREENEDLVEKLDWKSNSELSHRVLENIQSDHPELFDELVRQTENHSKHTQLSWVTQNPKIENEDTHRMNPDSTAGKIFMTFQTAAKETADDEAWESAKAVTEYLLRPLSEANGDTDFTNPTTTKDPAITLDEAIFWRIKVIKFDAAVAMNSNDDDSFVENIDKIQWLSKDLEYIRTQKAVEQDFNQRMLTKNSELFNELKSNREANSDAPNHPSWLTEDRNEAINDVFHTFQETMDGTSNEQREMVASSIAKTLIYSLRAENRELQGSPSESHESTPFINRWSYDHIMKSSMDFFRRRADDIQDFVVEAMVIGKQDVFEKAIHSLKDIKDQLENATQNGYSPAQHDSNHTNYDHNQRDWDGLSYIKEMDEHRGAALYKSFYGFAGTHILQQGALQPHEWVEHPHFEDAFREFTAQMLPGDRERLISSITERPEHSDPHALRERLNAILATED